MDIGGTFTDVLAIDAAGVTLRAKLRTDASDLSACFRSALKTVLSQRHGSAQEPDELLYGTTHALNALLTFDLPPIGLIVTRGFRELLETARLPSAEGAVGAAKRAAPPRLVPLERIGEVGARIDARGVVSRPIDEAEVAQLARDYRDRGFEVVAVSLLHSYVDPAHERELAAIFAREAPRIDVVLSSDVLPELREYERTLATCLNASLISSMGRHLNGTADAAQKHRLLMMKSSGGLSSAKAVARAPFATALSGPAAAVVGSAWIGRQIGIENLITIDIGGTSTDVSLVRDGEVALTTQGEVAGFPWKAPMVDLFSVGAGGGSIASAGADQRWHVGPESAGATPGPIAYRSGGTQVTLTDAQLVLGRLPAALLGGELALDKDAARDALSQFGSPRGFDAERAARGILEIATHQFCGAIRRVSVLRGHDPRDYALLAAGGAGPLHAAELAALLGMDTVVVPEHPGLAAAHGLMVADIREDFVRAFAAKDTDVDAGLAESIFADLEREGGRFLDTERRAIKRGALRRSIDMRYEGMLYESAIALPAGVATDEAILRAVDSFHDRFEDLTGYSRRGAEAVELLNLRVTAIGERDKAALGRTYTAPDAAPVPRESRPVGFLHHRGLLESAVYDRDCLGHGARVVGPAVIEQTESTIIVPPEFGASVDAFGNVMLRPLGHREESGERTG